MKKIFAIILSVVMMFSSIIFASYAADDNESSIDKNNDTEYNDDKVVPGLPQFGSRDWTDYNSYIQYNGNATGYSVNHLSLYVTDEFLSSGTVLDASYFPEIEDEIAKIEKIQPSIYVSDDDYDPHEYRIEFDWEFVSHEMLDEFISAVRYLTTFSFVEKVELYNVGLAELADPTDTNPTESSQTDPVDTDLEPEDDVTTEPDTTEALGAVTESDDTDKGGLNNPATGDRFFIYMSVLLLSAGVTFVITAAVTKRKVKK